MSEELSTSIDRIINEWETATPSNPFVLTRENQPLFCLAMKELHKREDYRIRCGGKITIVDKDKLLKDGIKSMADGEVYTTRNQYNEMLKRNHCIEVGDMAPTKQKKEISGDFNVQKELKEALNQHLFNR